MLLFVLTVVALHTDAQAPLSLEEAVARAVQNNFDIKVARLQAEVASNNNTWGETSALPRISANAGYSLNISDQSENPTSFIQAKIQTTGLEYGANMSWTLFDGLGMFASKRQLELLEAQSEGNAALIIENTVQAVTLAYFEVQVQREKLSLLQEVIALSRDRLAYAEVQKESGASTTFEILQFENAIVSDSTNYLLQKLAVRNAERNLNLIMDEEVESDWSLVTELTSPNVSYEYGVIWQEVSNNNQSLRNQVVNQLLSEQGTRLARAQMFPVVSFDAGITESDNQFEAGELAASGRTLNYFGSFTLQFNLYNGGKTRRALQNARLQEEIAMIGLDEQRARVQTDLRNALDTYNAQLAIYELTRENVANQKRALDIAEERFRNGVINSFDYRNQQVNYLNASTSSIEALQNLLNTHTTLVRLRGGLIK